MSKKNYIIPVFVPHSGCPFDCIFCNQKKITGLDTTLTANQIEEQIKDYAQSIGEKMDKHIEIAFFGGSFTGIDKDKQIEFLEIASRWYEDGYVDDIRLSTRPDYINTEILTYLRKYNVTIIELGVQSLDEEVLKKSFRGHSPESVLEASKLIKEMGFKLGLQMMLGLPGDNFYRAMDTAKKLISYGPDFVRIYPTLVIRGTQLEELFLTGNYKPLDVDTAVSISKELYKLFNKNNIPIIRIGLQPTENIMEGRDVIAGPFHPAFRQLVVAEIYKESIDDFLASYEEKINKIKFYVNPRSVSNVVGMKKSNINYFRSKYGVKEIGISKDSDLLKNEIKIQLNDNVVIDKMIL